MSSINIYYLCFLKALLISQKQFGTSQLKWCQINVREREIKNGQCREIVNTGYTRRRKTKQKHNTICVLHHYTQINTNNVSKTLAHLQTTRGKDEPNIGCIRKFAFIDRSIVCNIFSKPTILDGGQRRKTTLCKGSAQDNNRPILFNLTLHFKVKWKPKYYHSVGTVPTSNRNIIETEVKIITSNTHTNERLLTWLRTITSKF